jgi:hypothetical protein
MVSVAPDCTGITVAAVGIAVSVGRGLGVGGLMMTGSRVFVAGAVGAGCAVVCGTVAGVTGSAVAVACIAIAGAAGSVAGSRVIWGIAVVGACYIRQA